MADWIENAVAEVEKKQGELRQMMQAVNLFCGSMGLPPRYADAELQPTSGAAIRSGQFYGKPLATAVREYFETRPSGHAASGEAILAALEKGGFDFDALEWKEEFRLRSLIMSLSKNVQTFHRLPNSDFGLTIWYPDAVKNKKKKDEREEAEAAAAAAAEEKKKKRANKTKPPAPAGTDGAAA